MKLNKSIILSGIFALSSSIAFAGSDLVSVNNTDMPSTVKVTSGAYSGVCATELNPLAWTDANATTTTNWGSVMIMCGGVFPCKSDVYMGKNHNCSGIVIGESEIDDQGNVTINNNPDSTYALTSSGATMYINYK